MTAIEQQQFEQVYHIMEASFPEIEYRTRSGQRALLQQPEYRLITEREGSGEVVAFLAAWEFPEFRFVEHLAVDPQRRGGGTGGRLLKRYMKDSVRPIVLEVELPEEETACRRISFYERLGFRLNEYHYVQPPLRPESPELPLKIMSYPGLLAEEEFLACRALLYRKVYGVTNGQ